MLAVLNSAPSVSTPVDDGTPMPEWNWGVRAALIDL
jgi:hypothetical protein